MAFDDNLKVRNLTGAEMIEIAGNENLLEVQRFRQRFAEYKRQQYEQAQNARTLRPAKG